jgi:hypothetical protein
VIKKVIEPGIGSSRTNSRRCCTVCWRTTSSSTRRSSTPRSATSRDADVPPSGRPDAARRPSPRPLFTTRSGVWPATSPCSSSRRPSSMSRCAMLASMQPQLHPDER